MKTSDIIIFSIYCIGFILLISGTTMKHFEYKEGILIDCYDKNNNKIIGVKCIEYKSSDYSISSLIQSSGTMLILVGIFSMFFYVGVED